MKTLFIADRNPELQQEMAAIFVSAGFHVVTVGSVVDILEDIRRRKIHVLVLGSELNGLASVELIPLLRKCNRSLRIIVVADGISPDAAGFLKHKGVIYHGPRPCDLPGYVDLLRVVSRAFADWSEGEENSGDSDEQRGNAE